MNGEAKIAELSQKTDEELMLLYQKGDAVAFEELYYRYSGRVLGYLRTRIPSDDASEVLQQIFLKVHQNRLRFDPTLPFLPWLFTIAHHLVVDLTRKQKPLPETPEKIESLVNQSLELPVTDYEESKNWNEILAVLPPEQRKLIELRFQEGLSFEEISRKLGVNEVTLRKRMSRVMANARKAFSK